MNNWTKYIPIVLAIVFWGCLDFDDIIDFRETIYGECCEFGKEVELNRQYEGGDGATEFEKNALIVEGTDGAHVFYNQGTFWEFSFSTDEYGVPILSDFSPEGDLFLVGFEGQDSILTELDFYTQTGGRSLKLDRSLGIKKDTPNSELVDIKFGASDFLVAHIRDELFQTSTFKSYFYNETNNTWLHASISDSTLDVYRGPIEDLEYKGKSIKSWEPDFISSWDGGDSYYILVIDSDNKVELNHALESSEIWHQDDIEYEEDVFAHSFHFDDGYITLNLDLESSSGEDSSEVKIYTIDTYYWYIYQNVPSLMDSEADLRPETELQTFRHENEYFVVTSNPEQDSLVLYSSLSLYKYSGNLYGTGSWEHIQSLYGEGDFASSFDISLESNTLVVGEPGNDFVSQNAGAVHVYDLNPAELFEPVIQKLDIRVRTDFRDQIHFGWSVEYISSGSGNPFSSTNYGYNIYRKIWESGSDLELVRSIAETSFTDSTAVLDTNYVYYIVPFNQETGEEENKELHMELNQVVVRPLVIPENPPLNAPFSNVGISIDGLIDEEEWSDSFYTDFGNPDSSYLKVKNSDEYLWIGLKSAFGGEDTTFQTKLSFDVDKNLDWGSGYPSTADAYYSNEGFILIDVSEYRRDKQFEIDHYTTAGSYPNVSENYVSSLLESDVSYDYQIVDDFIYQEIQIPIKSSIFELGFNETKYFQAQTEYSYEEVTNFPEASHNLAQESFFELSLTGRTVDNELENESMVDYSLSQNYPNPFNPSTNISYSILETNDVNLTVYDMMGRKVATLVDEKKSMGIHSVNFDASNLSSGMYIYRLTAGNQSFTKKMMLIK